MTPFEITPLVAAVSRSPLASQVALAATRERPRGTEGREEMMREAGDRLGAFLFAFDELAASGPRGSEIAGLLAVVIHELEPRLTALRPVLEEHRGE